MRVIKAAQPIRSYGPPISVVWTLGGPCDEADCSLLTAALLGGEIDVIERGRWGPYSVILRWTHPEAKPLYFLAVIQEAPPSDEA